MHALEKYFSAFVSAVPNRFKYCQNTCFRDIVFKIVSEDSNRFKYVRIHASKETLLSIFFSTVPNRLNTVRMLDLETLFSKCSHFKLCRIARSTLVLVLPLQFQNIVSNSVGTYHFTVLDPPLNLVVIW